MRASTDSDQPAPEPTELQKRLIAMSRAQKLGPPTLRRPSDHAINASELHHAIATPSGRTKNWYEDTFGGELRAVADSEAHARSERSKQQQLQQEREQPERAGANAGDDLGGGGTAGSSTDGSSTGGIRSKLRTAQPALPPRQPGGRHDIANRAPGANGSHAKSPSQPPKTL